MDVIIKLVINFLKFALVIDTINKKEPEIEARKAEWEEIIAKLRSLLNF